MKNDVIQQTIMASTCMSAAEYDPIRFGCAVKRDLSLISQRQEVHYVGHNQVLQYALKNLWNKRISCLLLALSKDRCEINFI